MARGREDGKGQFRTCRALWLHCASIVQDWAVTVINLNTCNEY